jgi:D-glycero-alpha-D-manno-heptose-7-phosphate kinase
MPDFYRENGGSVISTAIDKYVFVMVNRKFDSGIRVAYSKTEEVASIAEIEHPLVRAGLRQAGLHGGIEIATVADIPSRGTGLGSSSTFTVGLMHALHAYCGRYVSSATLAEEACRIEIDICGEPIGKQDQYAAAFGGFNVIEFRPDGTVGITPLICQPAMLKRLQASLLLLYTGITRSASELLREQAHEVHTNADKRSILQRMVELCYTLRDDVQADNFDTFGALLHENWELKKRLTRKISNSVIDGWYETARRHGASGGKILGAGAGGFLLLAAPPELHGRICHALPALRRIPFNFERSGSQIILFSTERSWLRRSLAMTTSRQPKVFQHHESRFEHDTHWRYIG